MVRKIIGIGLLVGVLFNFMGYYLIMEVNRYMIRREMRTIDPRNKQVIALSVNTPEQNPDFRRVDEREIIFENNLYDVICESRQGTTTVFYCIHDVVEEKLLTVCNRIHTGKYNQVLWTLLVKVAIPEEYSGLSVIPASTYVYPGWTCSLLSEWLIPFTPPPKFFL